MKLWVALVASLMLACESHTNYAPDRNFYFEIIVQRNDKTSASLVDYLKNQIAAKKYTITNASGLTWPFYRELALKERIPKDSLMPPHWYVHKMIPLQPNQEIDQGEFLVRIYISSRPDTLPNYNVDIFRKDSMQLSLSGQSGVHYIDSTELSKNSLDEFFLKSIIRYSFK